MFDHLVLNWLFLHLWFYVYVVRSQEHSFLVYQLNHKDIVHFLNSINKEYKLIIVDSNNQYEETEITVEVDKNTNGATVNKSIYKKTNILFNVSELVMPLNDVEISVDGKKIITKTNTNGQVFHKIKFTK